MTWLGNPALDKTTNSTRVAEVNPLSTQYVTETITSGTLSSTADYYHYFDMSGFSKASFQIELTPGSAYSLFEVTVEGTLQDDGTAAAGCIYHDITNDIFGVEKLTNDGLLIDNTGALGLFKFIKIKIAYTHSSNSSYILYHKRMY